MTEVVIALYKPKAGKEQELEKLIMKGLGKQARSLHGRQLQCHANA